MTTLVNYKCKSFINLTPGWSRFIKAWINQHPGGGHNVRWRSKVFKSVGAFPVISLKLATSPLQPRQCWIWSKWVEMSLLGVKTLSCGGEGVWRDEPKEAIEVYTYIQAQFGGTSDYVSSHPKLSRPVVEHDFRVYAHRSFWSIAWVPLLPLMI